MPGPFRNPRTLFVVLLVHVVIQQIEGLPRDWQEYLEKINRNEVASVSRIYGAHRHLQELRMTLETGYSRQDDDRLDELTSDMDDAENNNDNSNDEIENVQDHAPEAEKTSVTSSLTEDEISQLIEDAIDKHVFLSPQEWDEALAQNPSKVPADEGMSAKVRKVRSPRGPSREPSQTTTTNQNDQIFFPGSKIPGQALDANTVTVPTCEGARFCTEKTDYPSDSEIKETLNRYYLPPVSDPPVIAERMGGDDKDSLCQLRTKKIRPISGLDQSKTWRLIFNNEEYVQTVNVEICTNLDQPCENFESGPKGYASKCVQKYVYRHLVGLGPNGTEMLPFEMPSSCCCQLIIPSD